MRPAISLSGIVFVCSGAVAGAQETTMSFFVTSQNPGSGGDFSGLEGADAYCGQLAEAAGVTGRTWRAYLSTSTENARDRIGDGPWHNAAGVLIAEDIAALHDRLAALTSRFDAFKAHEGPYTGEDERPPHY